MFWSKSKKPQVLPVGAKRVFAIISWGAAGTKWVAKILNAHPDIFSVHHGRAYIREALAEVDHLDDVAVLRMIRRMGEGYQLAGDVHGLNREQVPAMRTAFGDDFRCAVLVRDPQSRLRSQVALFEERDYTEAIWKVDYLKQVPSVQRVARYFSDRKKAMFMHGVNMLNAIVVEKTVGTIYRLEDLTTKPASVVRLVSELSADTIRVDEAWAAEVMRQPAVNPHKSVVRDAPILSLREKWQVEIIQAILQPEAVAIYRELGYEIPKDWQCAAAA
jgi:hypothetical protein